MAKGEQISVRQHTLIRLALTHLTASLHDIANFVYLSAGTTSLRRGHVAAAAARRPRRHAARHVVAAGRAGVRARARRPRAERVVAVRGTGRDLSRCTKRSFSTSAMSSRIHSGTRSTTSSDARGGPVWAAGRSTRTVIRSGAATWRGEIDISGYWDEVAAAHGLRRLEADAPRRGDDGAGAVLRPGSGDVDERRPRGRLQGGGAHQRRRRHRRQGVLRLASRSSSRSTRSSMPASSTSPSRSPSRTCARRRSSASTRPRSCSSTTQPRASKVRATSA